MKEKRVDILLAKASFYQIPLIGFGGAFLTELIKYGDARLDVLVGSGLLTVIFYLKNRAYYSKANEAIKKENKKQ